MKDSTGFTLFELVIVLAIIAAMVTVIAPYASRSNESLELDNRTREIVETLKYAINLAEIDNQRIRFYLDTNRKSFYLETADEDGHFPLISTSVGRERYLSSSCHLMDIEGFEMEGQCCYLEFDPMQSWPSGHFVIFGNEFQKKIEIQSKTISITDEGAM